MRTVLISVCVAVAFSFLHAAPSAASQPRYCDAFIDALAAEPDPSLFPLDTPRKRKLAEKAFREQQKLFRKAYLLARADRNSRAATALYWWTRPLTSWGEQGLKEFESSKAQVKRDCGVGFPYS